MKQISSIALLILVISGVLLGIFFFHAEKTPVLPQSETTEAKPTYTIIAFGDSLTAGFGLPLSESYPAQLATRLKERGVDAEVINAGVSGETSRGNLERAQFIRSQNPTIVLLGIGGNDALRLLPLNETEANIRNTLTTLTSGENPPEVILLEMQAPLNVGPAYKQQFDALYATLEKEYRIPLVPFITEEVFLTPAYKLADGIHLNKEGYGKIVDDYVLATVLNALPSE